MGFTFDDTDTKGVAIPIAMMHELIAKDPRNAERIFPYIGGEEVNDSPDSRPSSLRHQLRRDDRGGGAAMARLDADRRREGQARTRLADNREIVRDVLVAVSPRHAPSSIDAIRGLERVLV